MTQFNFFRYTRNDGATHYAIRHRIDLAAIADFGFAAASAADPPAPKGFRPRVVYLLDPVTGRKRADVVATPAAYATVTAAGHTIALPEVGSAGTTTFGSTGGRDEGVKTPHLIHPA